MNVEGVFIQVIAARGAWARRVRAIDEPAERHLGYEPDFYL
jgi:hypothetical protein